MEKIRLQLFEVLIGDVERITTSVNEYLNCIENNKDDNETKLRIFTNISKSFEVTLSDLHVDKYMGAVQIVPIHLMGTMVRLVNSTYNDLQNYSYTNIKNYLKQLNDIKAELIGIKTLILSDDYKELYDRFEHDMKSLEEFINIYITLSNIYQLQRLNQRSLAAFDELVTCSISGLFNNILVNLNKYTDKLESDITFKIIDKDILINLIDDCRKLTTMLNENPYLSICELDINNIETGFNMLIGEFVKEYIVKVLGTKVNNSEEYGISAPLNTEVTTGVDNNAE